MKEWIRFVHNVHMQTKIATLSMIEHGKEGLNWASYPRPWRESGSINGLVTQTKQWQHLGNSGENLIL